MSLLYDNHLTEYCGVDQRGSIALIGAPKGHIGLFEVLAADPLRALPFALLFSKYKPDKKCF
jgi:hypothetical protein